MVVKGYFVFKKTGLIGLSIFKLLFEYQKETRTKLSIRT